MYVLERRIVYAFTFTQMLYWCLFINRAITLEWAHKHFVLSVYTFFISTKVFRNVVCSWWLFWARLNVFNGKRRLQPAVRNKQKRQNNDWVPRRTGIVHTSSILKQNHMVVAYFPWYFTRRPAWKPRPRRGSGFHAGSPSEVSWKICNNKCGFVFIPRLYP